MADTKLYDILGVSKSASDSEIKRVSCYLSFIFKHNIPRLSLLKCAFSLS